MLLVYFPEFEKKRFPWQMNLSVFLPKLSGNFYVVDAADGSPWLRL